MLNLSNNLIEGAIARDIGNLLKLRVLVLAENKIDRVPPELGKCVKLECLDLTANQMTEFPAIGDLCQLTELYLGANLLDGTIPSWIGNLKELERFRLDDNSISEIPPAIIHLQKLRLFDISSNRIRAIPYELCTLPKLQCLRLSDNLISVAPLELAQLTTLRALKLMTGNSITELPAEFNSLRQQCRPTSGGVPMHDLEEMSPI